MSGIPNQDATGTFWDNASLAVLLALEIQADLLILLSDVEGLYTGPLTEPTSQLIHTYLKEKHDDDMVMFGAKSRVGRGGLTAKVYSAWQAASAGIPVVISSVCAADGLQRVMRGELIGTLFHKDAHLWVDQKETGARDIAVKRKIVKTAKRVTTCDHSCEHHAKLMDVALWSGLPEEVQELVFARLPWPQIYRVRFLSKGWDQKLMSGSQLKQACARAQPKSFALLAQGDGLGSFKVTMFDTVSNRWHTFETSPGYDPECGEIQLVSACDGGLVCFLSEVQWKPKKNTRLVFVCNPLSRVWKQLPPLYGIVQPEIMVQLIMDLETKHYRVIVVGYCKGPKVGNVVKVYHSETGQWTTVDGSASGEVFYGYNYLHIENDFSRFKPVPCSYNFADGLVGEIITCFPRIDHCDSVLVKDRLFCPKDVGLPTRCIEEYEAVGGGASWILVKKYFLNRLPLGMIWRMTIRACKDFLLVYVYDTYGSENRLEFLWLYEFSVEGWRELPIMPAASDFLIYEKEMCELCLDSVP